MTVACRELDRALVERIVQFCLRSREIDSLQPGAHIVGLAIHRFGERPEFFEAIDILVRMSREILKLEEIEAAASQTDLPLWEAKGRKDSHRLGTRAAIRQRINPKMSSADRQ
jgi:hypothetical protein